MGFTLQFHFSKSLLSYFCSLVDDRVVVEPDAGALDNPPTKYRGNLISFVPESTQALFLVFLVSLYHLIYRKSSNKSLGTYLIFEPQRGGGYLFERGAYSIFWMSKQFKRR